MITDESQSIMQLERSKVSVSSYLEKTELMGSTVAASSSFDQAMKTMVVRLEAILYGRDVASDTTESNEITVEEFDPSGVWNIPATWRDHLLLDISSWLNSRAIRRGRIADWWRWWRNRLDPWLARHCRQVPAPQSHRPRVIPRTINTRRVTAVCPHVGSQAKIDRHLRFVAFNLHEPRGAFNVAPMDLDNGVAHPLEGAQEWREHVFRHHLLAICSEMDKVFGMKREFGSSASLFGPSFDHASFYSLLMKVKDLFDQYGVGA